MCAMSFSSSSSPRPASVRSSLNLVPGARKLIFEPTSDVLRGVVKARITQSVSRWLGHRLTLEGLEVTFAGNLIEVEIKYRPAGSPDSRVVKFQRAGS